MDEHDIERERACTELLRREAQRQGLLDAGDQMGEDGVISRAAMEAIEALIEREVQVPEPDEQACRRHHAAHPARYSRGERVRARHILFAVTPGVDVNGLRRHAEQVLLDVRAEPERFADQAGRFSNCPSGAQGGDLGWLAREDCAPEFAQELFAHAEVGVLPRLVHSRFGLHVVEVLERQPGELQPFDSVRGAVALALKQQSYVTALRQYLRLLEAESEGASPLVQ
ncbi:MAG: peptidylprolyl isomerase [Pseudomonadota bacterium]